MKDSMHFLIKKLEDEKKSLISILNEYQPRNVSEYEIERCIKTIQGLSVNDQYLECGKKINSMAIMLPSNLPLYSLFIFAIIPAILCKEIFVRPNAMLQENDTISKIYHALNIDIFFPEIKIINQDHAGFKQYIQQADLVVFTGKPSNASIFLKEMKTNSILAINGAGHNPLVITETADIDKAVEGALMLKGFNGGQDCAGPDAILVHSDVAEEFIQKFQDSFTNLKTGSFNELETMIGPIHRFTELTRLASLLHDNRKDIVSGGFIDFRHSIVQPTTIVRSINRYPNYQEVYGPITFIHPYQNDKDLSTYFEDANGQYASNRMYVSVYGNSPYALARNDLSHPGQPNNIGIVLHNQTIHDVEIGYNAYGGYSMGASGLIKKMSKSIQQTAMPILLPQVIVDYIIKNNDLPVFHSKSMDNQGVQALKTLKEVNPIVLDFQKIVTDIFCNSYHFSFIFGSAAKGNLKIGRDDLDTFICLIEHSEEKIDEYKNQLTKLHQSYNLKEDKGYPTEIMTLSRLKKAINYCKSLDVSLNMVISGEVFDNLFWVHALSDKKIGFLGDGRLMSSLIKATQPHILRWRNQIVDQIEKTDNLPLHIKTNFPGLNKAKILEKINTLTPHLVIHLCLNYTDKKPNLQESMAVEKAIEPTTIKPSASVISQSRGTLFSTDKRVILIKEDINELQDFKLN